MTAAPSPFPALEAHIVVVPGPSAAGIYDLKAGAFHRVTLAAGELLASCDGLVSLHDRKTHEQQFILDAAGKGLVALQNTANLAPRTTLAAAIRPLRPPRFAWVEITARCNQVCLHCFLGEELNRGSHVSLDKLQGYADELCALGVRQVVITGGEPTTHPRFEHILRYFAEKSFALTVLTNGSHKNALKHVDLFRQLNVTAKIPLLGWGATHDAMTGMPGSFERAINTVKQFVAGGVRTQLGSTITAINKDDAGRLRAFASEVGLAIEFSPIFLVGYARDNQPELVPESMEQIISVCQSCNNHGSGKSADVQRVRAAQPDDYAAVDLHDYLTAHHECGQKIVAVLASGAVTPCLLLRQEQHRIGDLNMNSLTDIVQGRGDRASFDANMSLERIPGCSECEARYVCKAGGCPASAYGLTGFVARKNPLYDKCYYEAAADMAASR